MTTHDLFSGSIKLFAADADHDGMMTCEFDGACDASGLGRALGLAARQFMQVISPGEREREFRALLAAFVVSAADARPVKVLGGSTDIVPIGASSKVPS